MQYVYTLVSVTTDPEYLRDVKPEDFADEVFEAPRVFLTVTGAKYAAQLEANAERAGMGGDLEDLVWDEGSHGYRADDETTAIAWQITRVEVEA